MTLYLAIGLLVWGSVVATDLITVPQGLLSRPLVAASLAGAMAGDLSAGLLVGAVLELYSLEVLPIGATRYPDYGPGAVAAGAAAALAPAAGSLAVAGLVGLPLGLLGGWTIHRHRRGNARRLSKALDSVSAGDARAIWYLQRAGLWRDAARGLGLSAVGLLAIWIVRLVDWPGVQHRELLGWAVLAGGLTAGLGGALRLAGTGSRRRWLALGLLSGIVVAAWR